jgi:tRNA modification GTPase
VSLKIKQSDNIFSPITLIGRSAITVFRISGYDISSVVSSRNNVISLEPRKSTYIKINCSLFKDVVLVTYFPSPHSYTGEDVIEISIHGGRVNAELFINYLSRSHNIRQAKAGEFTKRALINDKIDLLQSEAIVDLIDSKTYGQAKIASDQLFGSLSSFCNKIRLNIIDSLALVEAYIDFPDQDLPKEVTQNISNKIVESKALLDEFMESESDATKIRSGFSVSIIGPTNVGKSSLMNHIAQDDIAIVSNVSGTTRDILSKEVNLSGYLVGIHDTAGIRESACEIEKIGIAKAKKIAAESDFTLVMFDINHDQEFINKFLTENKVNAKKSLVIINKSELSNNLIYKKTKYNVEKVSIKEKRNLKSVFEHIESHIQLNYKIDNDLVYTRLRHKQNIVKAISFLRQAQLQKDIILMSENLRNSIHVLNEMIGSVNVEEVLDSVFTKFCIGK